MSKETDSLFEAFFALEDIRELLRQSAPKHELTDEQKKVLENSLETLKKQITSLEALK